MAEAPYYALHDRQLLKLVALRACRRENHVTLAGWVALHGSTEFTNYRPASSG